MWLSKVELWDTSDDENKSTRNGIRRYLVLMKSIKSSKDKELKRTAHIEFVENLDFNIRTREVIKNMVRKLEEKSRKTG